MSAEGDPLLYQIGGAVGTLVFGAIAAILGVRKGFKHSPPESNADEDRRVTQAREDELRRVQAVLDAERLLSKVGEEFEAVRTEFRLVTESLKESLHGRMSKLSDDLEKEVAGLRANVHQLDVTVANLKGRLKE